MACGVVTEVDGFKFSQSPEQEEPTSDIAANMYISVRFIYLNINNDEWFYKCISPRGWTWKKACASEYNEINCTYEGEDSEWENIVLDKIGFWLNFNNNGENIEQYANDIILENGRYVGYDYGAN